MVETAEIRPPATEADIRRFLESGDLPGADRACAEALEANETDSVVHFLRGAILNQLGRHEDAVVHSQRAIDLGLRDWSNHQFLGTSLRALGRRQEARAAFGEACRLSPTSADPATLYLQETLTLEGLESAERLYAELAGRIADPGFKDAWEKMASAVRPPEQIIAKYLAETPVEARGLNLGCGGATFPGWVNIDTEYPWHQTILWDLSGGLPFVPDGTFSYVYSEHFMEHIPRKSALELTRDCFRALRSGGHIRIAMPDLDDLLENYRLGAHFPEDHKEFEDFFGGMFHTRGEWLNIAMRAWGHTYIYNFEDVDRLLQAVGFTDVRRVELGRSEVPMLAGRETRPAQQSSLIVEARKP